MNSLDNSFVIYLVSILLMLDMPLEDFHGTDARFKVTCFNPSYAGYASGRVESNKAET